MRLTVRGGPDEGATAEVGPGTFVIGRDEGCDLVLVDESVSRRHASLEVDGGGAAVLRDLGSRNGTYVDGSRVDGPVDLRGGEELRLGDTVVRVDRPAVTIAPSRTEGLALRVESEQGRGRTAEPAGDDWVVGRGEDCDLVLADPAVSGRHASLAALPDGTAVIADLGSRNGTFVDGRQIHEPVRLAGGERLRLGDTILSVRAPERPAATVAAATIATELGLLCTVASGEELGRAVPVTGEDLVVGRDESAGLVLSDERVSRRHASLRRAGLERAVLTDLGSRNGTLVDGARIEGPVEVGPEQRIQVGDTLLRVGAERLDPSALSPHTRHLATIARPADALRREPRLSTEALARACARRAWLVLALWLLALAAGAAVAGTRLTATLSAEFGVLGDAPSLRADRLLAERLRGPKRLTEFVVVRSADLTVADARFRDAVAGLHREVTALGPDVVLGGRNFLQARDDALVSRDGRATLLAFTLAGDFDQAEGNVSKVLAPVRRLDADPAFEASATGDASVAHNLQSLAEEDLKKGESIGLAVAFVVLLLVFGTLVASVLPVVVALFSIGIALGLATLLGQVLSLSIFTTNMIVGMGLALGIDYALFVLTRYREERSAGRDVSGAIAAAGATSSRAVLFSGLAVILALLALTFIPERSLRSVGIGAILVGALSVLAALTLLPALLALLGDRVNRLALPLVSRAGGGSEQRFWGAVAGAVMRRPVLSLVVFVALLVAAALPAADLRTGNVGVTGLPADAPARRGFEALQRAFPAAQLNPVEVVVAGDVGTPEVRRALATLRARLAGEPLFGPSRLETRPQRRIAVVSMPLRADPKDPRATAAVRRLRDTHVDGAFASAPGVEVLVTGATAQELDSLAITDGALPYVLAFVLGLSFVLLTVAFRSIVVPAKAVAMNLLSVGAAYGLIVLVFQKGVGAELLGFEQVDRIEAWVPLFLFAVLFGLSMDYHVFLLSRIRERYNETGDNAEAVREGVASTARIITGAALIMVAVFTGFALGELGPFQQLGFGMAVALALDATIVRSVLVPAGMRLLGARNWYLPRWLRWLPDVSVEGEAPPPARLPPAPAP